jgi:NAD(P)-dependent dehydrogenase (short-subunit alcohol dehydrogenase family)
VPRRVALVTGASGNLGAAIVEQLADEGCDVAVHYRSSHPDALLRNLSARGIRHLPVQADLADAASAIALVDRVVRELGPIDVLVDNAADQSVGSLDQLSAADWDAMLRATFLSAVHVTTRAAETMPSGGSIVTVSSVEALTAFPAHAHYAAAKAALVSYTRSLALELAPRGIRANTVAAGLIERTGLAQSWPQGHEWWTRSAPLARPVSAAEVARAVAFLAGEGASGITGALLPVDGGWSASARAPF